MTRHENAASVMKRSASYAGLKGIGLDLTVKALNGYDNIVPLDIVRNLDGTYRFTGAFENDNMTAGDVNDFLEDIADSMEDDGEDE